MKPLRIAALALALALLPSGVANARDPGRWTLTGWSSLPTSYWQGVASAGPGQPFFFSGVVTVLHRTGTSLRQTCPRLQAGRSV